MKPTFSQRLGVKQKLGWMVAGWAAWEGFIHFIL